MVLETSLWIRLANYFGGQVYLWLKCTLGAISEFVGGLLSVFLLFLEECILAFVEVFEISVEHVGVLTYPFARLRNIWLILPVFGALHGIASRSQRYILMHCLEKVALEPICGIFVKTVLDI